MGFFKRAKPASPDHVAPAVEQAVITHLMLSGREYGTEDEREAVQSLGERIEVAVAAVGGEHDGDEFGNGEAVLYTYGPDADAILDAIRSCLVFFDMKPGSYAIKRYGAADDPSSRELRVELS